MGPLISALGVLILLFSVIVHEVMHGVAAKHFGDHTADRAGRLTLNPIPHIDPIGTILLPGLLILSHSPVLFGWAKPVPVNPLNFTNIKKGELWTSAAGILINLTIAVLTALIFHLTLNSGNDLITQLLIYTININLILAIFNSFPIPPLDGSKILLTLLPRDLALKYQALEKYGPFILLFLLLLPIGGSSVINLILRFLLTIFQNILGI